MKQENITLFNVHVAGKMTSQDADALQPLLRSANDEAFTILMKHKTKKRTIVGYVCWLILLASLAHLLFSQTDNFLLNLLATVVVILSILILLLIPSVKKRRYRDYRTILEEYQ
ncbi:MAG: hypothetical protein KBT40_04560 [bacterium]|nr:hypothetical protein [Candidatus Minthenecus merdequi]